MARCGGATEAATMAKEFLERGGVSRRGGGEYPSPTYQKNCPKNFPPSVACLRLNPALLPLIGVPTKNRLPRSCKASTRISMKLKTRRLLCEDEEDASCMGRWNSVAGIRGIIEFFPLRFFCLCPHFTVGWCSSHILPLGGLYHSSYR